MANDKNKNRVRPLINSVQTKLKVCEIYETFLKYATEIYLAISVTCCFSFRYTYAHKNALLEIERKLNTIGQKCKKINLQRELPGEFFKMKVFVTGATGFVGSFLTEALLNKGYQVRVLVRTTSNLRWIADLDVDCFYADLDDKEALKRGLKDVDYVFHAAGLTKALHPEDYYRVNYDGTRKLVEAVLEAKPALKRFLYVSSQAAVGPSPTLEPIDESAEPHPVTDYGRSKLKAEQFVYGLRKEMPVTIVRPPAVYGPRDTDILQFFKTVKMGIIPRIGNRERYFSLIYVKDLVQGMIKAAELKKPQGKIYFLANPQPYSWDTVAKITLKVLRRHGMRINVPMFVMRAAAAASEGISKITAKPSIINRQKINEIEQSFWVCSPARAKRDFGFVATTRIEQGIKETLEWYSAVGWL